MANGLESLPAPERRDTPKEMAELDKSVDKSVKTVLDKRIKEMENAAECQKFAAKDSLDRYKRTYALNNAAMKDIEKRMNTERNPLEQKRVEQILEALRTAPPETNGERVEPALKRYIYMPGRPKKGNEAFTLYKTDTEAVVADIQFLRTMQQVYPESNAALEEMICGLTKFMEADVVSFIDYGMARARSNTPANKAMKDLGRMGAVFVLGAATLLTGVMSIARRQFSIAPLLYGGALLFTVNPNLFKGKDRELVVQSQNILGNPEFLCILKTRNIQGEEWAGIVERIIKKDGNLGKLLKDFNPNDAMRHKEIVDELAPKQGPVRDNLLAMFNKPQEFGSFLKTLEEAKDGDVRKLVESYVRKGAWTAASPQAIASWRASSRYSTEAPIVDTKPIDPMDNFDKDAKPDFGGPAKATGPAA